MNYQSIPWAAAALLILTFPSAVISNQSDIVEINDGAPPTSPMSLQARISETNETLKRMREKNLLIIKTRNTDESSFSKYYRNRLEKILKRDMPRLYTASDILAEIYALGRKEDRRSKSKACELSGVLYDLIHDLGKRNGTLKGPEGEDFSKVLSQIKELKSSLTDPNDRMVSLLQRVNRRIRAFGRSANSCEISSEKPESNPAASPTEDNPPFVLTRSQVRNIFGDRFTNFNNKKELDFKLDTRLLQEIEGPDLQTAGESKAISRGRSKSRKPLVVNGKEYDRTRQNPNGDSIGATSQSVSNLREGEVSGDHLLVRTFPNATLSVVTDAAAHKIESQQSSSFTARTFSDQVISGLKKLGRIQKSSDIQDVILTAITNTQNELMKQKKFKPVASTMSFSLNFQGADGKQYAVTGHLGDAAVYHVRDGTVTELSPDTISQGEAKKALSNSGGGFGENGNRTDMHQWVSRKKGNDLLARFQIFPVNAGDRIILGSDGLRDNMTPNEIQQSLEAEGKRSTRHRLIRALNRKTNESVEKMREMEERYNELIREQGAIQAQSGDDSEVSEKIKGVSSEMKNARGLTAKPDDNTIVDIRIGPKRSR